MDLQSQERPAQQRKRLSKGCFKASDGVMVEYIHINNSKGRTVSFISGLSGCDGSEWSRQMRMRSFDMLFHKTQLQSGSLKDGSCLHSRARHIVELCGHLGIAETDLVGHSMGGLIAALVYNGYRDAFLINTMTLVSCPGDDPMKTLPYATWLSGWKANGGMFDEFKLLMAGWLSRKVHRRDRGIARKYFGLEKGKAAAAAFLAMHFYGEEIGKMMAAIEAPVLIAHSRRDPIVSYDASLRMHERIKGSELHTFEGFAHSPMYAEPQEFNRVLTAFLDAHPPKDAVGASA
jgi:pimeloyl-ACP methyl ester carboxylesterase